MPDEDIIQSETAPETPSTEAGTPPAPPTADATPKEPAAPAAPDWRQLIEQAPKEDFVRHPRVAGTAGEIAKRMFEQHKADFETQQRAEADRKAAEDARLAADAERERLRQLRRVDPLAYAQEMEDLDAEQEKARAEAARKAAETTYQQQARQDSARWFAAGLQNLPDWKEFSEADIQQLAKAVAGLQRDEEVLAAFSSKAVEILADKRLAKEKESFKAKELAREREALKKEVAAEILAQGAAPDLARPQGIALRRSPDASDPRAYNEWYEKNVLGR